jgi:hypothetical protein
VNAVCATACGWPNSEKGGFEMRLWLLGTLIFVALSLCGCKDKGGTDDGGGIHIDLTLLDFPGYLAANVDSFYTIRVQVSDLSVQVDSVVGMIFNSSHQQMLTRFRLYDDGSTDSLRDAPSYASSPSGDIAANNGTCTRRIHSVHLAHSIGTGSFVLQVQANGPGGISGGPLGGTEATFQLDSVEPCLITSIPVVPFLLPTCFDPFTLELRTWRAPQDRVDSVTLVLSACWEPWPPLGRARFEASQGDSVWQLGFSPTLMRCASERADCYWLNLTAYTRYGFSCSPDTGLLFLYTPDPTVLTDCTLPDTIWRPVQASDTDTVIVTVNLTDCELTGVTDFFGLHFDVSRDDTLNWSTGDNYFLRDDGQAPDSTAGNGVYTVGLTFNRSDTYLNNVYYFRFYADICGLDRSGYLLDSVRVVQPPGLALSPPGGELDLTVISGLRAAER